MPKSTLEIAKEISDELLGSGATSGNVWINENDRGYGEALSAIQKALLQINIIKQLLQKDVQIELALSIVASDLASLVASLNSASK